MSLQRYVSSLMFEEVDISYGDVRGFSFCKDQHRPVPGCYTAARFSSSEVMRCRVITQCKPDGPENTGLTVQRLHSPEVYPVPYCSRGCVCTSAVHRLKTGTPLMSSLRWGPHVQGPTAFLCIYDCNHKHKLLSVIEIINNYKLPGLVDTSPSTNNSSKALFCLVSIAQPNLSSI